MCRILIDMGVGADSAGRAVSAVVLCLVFTACPSGSHLPKGYAEVRLRPARTLIASDLSDAADTMTARLQSFGATQGSVRVQAGNLSAAIPTNARDRVVALLTKEGRVEFRPVIGSAVADHVACGVTDPSAESKIVDMCVRSARTNLVLGPARLTNPDIRSARAVVHAKQKDWAVALQLQPGAAEIFIQLTGELACFKVGSLRRELAIVVDGIIESHPSVSRVVRCQKGIVGSLATIEGNSEQDAKDLAVLLDNDPLPTPFRAEPDSR